MDALAARRRSPPKRRRVSVNTVRIGIRGHGMITPREQLGDDMYPRVGKVTFQDFQVTWLRWAGAGRKEAVLT
ncbi:hypothetical protein QR680_018220 [Steinernema hermaphroditum]|uniref:Uncharacterized protein n=1 Tax=Steinernema hermaphroditum TaxID=289476 RepID=A0AA39LQN4_9BILA|nr:hypothetical protein QR680_018220 [Steinernema hermaphroditum]